MPDAPIVTFHSGERTFERVFTGGSLESLKATVRAKLGLEDTEPLQLTQLRKKRRIDLDDERDFEAFAVRAGQDGAVEVEVAVPHDEHPDVPPKKKQRADARQPTLIDSQPPRFPEPAPPAPQPLAPAPTQAQPLAPAPAQAQPVALLPPAEIAVAGASSSSNANTNAAEPTAEPVKAKPGRKRKQQANAEEPAAPAAAKRRKTKGAAATADTAEANDASAAAAAAATEEPAASASTADSHKNSTRQSHEAAGAPGPSTSTDDMQAMLREYNERRRGTLTSADILQKHLTSKRENEAKKASRRRSSSRSSAEEEEHTLVESAVKLPRAKTARPAADTEKEKAKKNDAGDEPAPVPAPEPSAAAAVAANIAAKARWKQPVAPNTDVAAAASVPAPAAAAVIGDTAALAPEGSTSAEALAAALALAHPHPATVSEEAQRQSQHEQDPSSPVPPGATRKKTEKRYERVPCPVCETRPFHLRYECPIIKGGEASVRARLAEALKNGKSGAAVVGELERWLAREDEKKKLQQKAAADDKAGERRDGERAASSSSSDSDEDDEDSSSDGEVAQTDPLPSRPLTQLDMVDLDALIRGPGPARSSLAALIPDKSDEEDAEDDSEEQPEEPVLADDDGEDAELRRQRRLSRGTQQLQIIAHSSSESSDSESDSDAAVAQKKDAGGGRVKESPRMLSAAARSFADLNGPASSQFQAAYRRGDDALTAIAAAEDRLSPSVLTLRPTDVLTQASEAEQEEEPASTSFTRVLTPPAQPQTQEEVSPIQTFTQTPRNHKELVVLVDTPRRMVTYAKQHRTPRNEPEAEDAQEEGDEEEEEEEEEEKDKAKEEAKEKEKTKAPKEKQPVTANAGRRTTKDKDAKDAEPVKRGRAASVPANTAAAKREALKKKLATSATQPEGDDDNDNDNDAATTTTAKKKRASSLGGRPRLADTTKAEKEAKRLADKEAKRLERERKKAEREAEKEAKRLERERKKAEREAAKAAKGPAKKGRAKKDAAPPPAVPEPESEDDAADRQQPAASTSASAAAAAISQQAKKSRISLPGWETVPALEPSSPRGGGGASSSVDQLESSQTSPVAIAFPQPVASPHISSVDDMGEVDASLDLGMGEEDTPRPKTAASSPGASKTLPAEKPTFLSQRPQLPRRSDTRGITGLSSFTLSPLPPPKTKAGASAVKANAFREADELAQIGEDSDSDDSDEADKPKPAAAAHAKVPAKHRKAGVGGLLRRVSSPHKR